MGNWLFGKPAAKKGLHVHFATKDGKARCDKGLDVIISKGYSIKDVTCNKCQRYADFKQAETTINNPNRRERKMSEIEKGEQSEGKEAESIIQPEQEKPVPQKEPPPYYYQMATTKNVSSNQEGTEITDKTTNESPPSMLVAVPLCNAGSPVFEDIDVVEQEIFENEQKALERAEVEESENIVQEKSEVEVSVEEGAKAIEKSEQIEQEETINEEKLTISRRKDPFIGFIGTHKKIFIRHTPTNQIMFSDVDPKALDTCLKYLNKIDIQWKSQEESVPQGFVTAIREAFETAYRLHNLPTGISTITPEKTPEEIEEKRALEALELLTPSAKKGSWVEMPNSTYLFDGKEWHRIKKIEKEKEDVEDDTDITKSKKQTIDHNNARAVFQKISRPEIASRTIKRRARVGSGKIKRREKPAKNNTPANPGKQDYIDSYGFVKGGYRSYIMNLFTHGVTYQEMISSMEKEYGFKRKESESKIQIMLKVCRVRGHIITVTINKTKELDYYKYRS